MSIHAPTPYRDERPWGSELWLTKGYGEPSMVKLLNIQPGEILSLQTHQNRDEFWHVISGEGYATVGEDRIALASGSYCFVPRTVAHRIECTSSPLVILELAFGDFDERDIVRIEDKYGRA